MLKILIIVDNDYCNEYNTKEIEHYKKISNTESFKTTIDENNLIIFTQDSIPKHKPYNISTCKTTKTTKSCTSAQSITTQINDKVRKIILSQPKKYLNTMIDTLNNSIDATNIIGIDYNQYLDEHNSLEVDVSKILIPDIKAGIDGTTKTFIKLNKSEYCFWHSISAFNYHHKLIYASGNDYIRSREFFFDRKNSTGLCEYIIKYVNSNESYNDIVITVNSISSDGLYTIIFGIIFVTLYEELSKYNITFNYTILDDTIDINEILVKITEFIKERFSKMKQEYLEKIVFNVIQNGKLHRYPTQKENDTDRQYTKSSTLTYKYMKYKSKYLNISNN